MKGKGSKVFVYILLGLLILGLAGFGIGSFGGNVRSIGKVGDTDIAVEDYANALQAELRNISQQAGRAVSLREMQAVGLDREVLNQVVTAAALENEAVRLGLSVGDEIVAAEIRRIPGFAGIDGTFDRQAYEFALRNSGVNASDFEENARSEAAASLLQAAVMAGVQAPSTYADTLFGYLAERRSFSWARLSTNDIALDLGTPTKADLAAVYAENPEKFTLPETRTITYASLTPEMLIETIDIPEAELRDAYAARLSEFVQPERRILYRLVFATQSDAEMARAAIDANTTDLETLALERGLTLDDIALGEVARADLPDSVSEPIFALEDTGLVGPLSTDLGPALFRVAALLNAQETPFEEVREDLHAELAIDRAERAVSAEAEPIDDLLAGGATLEELVNETDMHLDTIEVTANSDAGLAAYQAFRDAAMTAAGDDFPELIELEDGGLVVLRVDAVRDPRVQPIEEVTASVRDLWTQQATMTALRAQAETTLGVLDQGLSMSALGLAPVIETDRTRDAFIDGTPPALLSEAFLLPPGGRVLVDGNAEIYIVELIEVKGPDLDNEQGVVLRQVLARQATQSMSQDMFDAFSRAVQQEAGLYLDQAAINAVHAQFP